MEIAFNPDGSLKLPGKVGELHEQRKERIHLAEGNPRAIVECLNGSNAEESWRITLSSLVPPSILFHIKKWTYAQGSKKFERIGAHLEDEGQNRFLLTVNGGGFSHAWAHMFLSALKTALLDECLTLIDQRNTCAHQFIIRTA